MSNKAEKRGPVPKLRFPEFWEAGEWGEKPLGDFLTESRIPGSKGDVAKKITVKLWGNGVFSKNEATQGSVNTQYFRRKAGQFIYSKLDFLNQAFGIVPATLDNYESTVDLPCFDFSEGIDSGFLLEYVKRKSFYEKNGEEADGSRKAKRIQVEAFLSFPILLPELVEQKKIADCLASLDELITLEAQKLGTLKTHKKGLMQQLFPAEGETLPKLRFPEFRDAEEWGKKKLGAVATLYKGKGISKAEIVANGVQPCIRYGELYTIYGETIHEIASSTNVDASELFFSKKNDVIIPASGETKIDIAKASCVMSDDIALGGDLNVIRSTQNGIFLSYQLNGPLRLSIAKVAQGDTVVHLYPTQIEQLDVLVPSPIEQQKIADCLASLDDLITAQTQKLAALKTHKKGLMQQLFPALESDREVSHG